MSLQKRISITTHYDDEDQRRQANVVLVNDEHYEVELYEDGELLESRIMQTDGYFHSESYAESCAENWVLGYGY